MNVFNQMITLLLLFSFISSTSLAEDKSIKVDGLPEQRKCSFRMDRNAFYRVEAAISVFDKLIELDTTEDVSLVQLDSLLSSYLSQQSPPINSSMDLVAKNFQLVLKFLEDRVDVEGVIAQIDQIYGLDNGYGEAVTRAYDPKQWQSSQQNLHTFLTPVLPKVHISGINAPAQEAELFSKAVIRRALRLQALKILQARAGVSPIALNKLVDAVNNETFTLPQKNTSLGASGDLIPMATAIKTIFKKPEDINGPFDIIGMVNTNAIMASSYLEILKKFKYYLEVADLLDVVTLATAGYGLENIETPASQSIFVNGSVSSGADSILRLYQHFLSATGFETKDFPRNSRLQPKYGPRVHVTLTGPMREALPKHITHVVESAIANSQNPLFLFPGDLNHKGDVVDKVTVRHSGLFNASALASVGNTLAINIMRMGTLADEQFKLMLDSDQNGPVMNSDLIDDKLGLGSLKGIDITSNSTLQSLKGAFALPVNFTASAESGNQNIVSGAATLAKHLNQMLYYLHIMQTCQVFGIERAIVAHKVNLGREVSAEEVQRLKVANFEHYDLEAALKRITGLTSKELFYF